jgi:hypothetical protein
MGPPETIAALAVILATTKDRNRVKVCGGDCPKFELDAAAARCS